MGDLRVGCPVWPLTFNVSRPLLLHLVKLLFLIDIEHIAELAVDLFADAPHLASPALL